MDQSTYTVVEGDNVFELQERVKSLIARGYEPTGGVQVVKNENTAKYYQAMYRRPTDSA